MTILAAIDENERSRTVVSVAHNLADTYGDRLVVLHVIPRDEFEAHRTALEDVPEFADFSIEQEAESARQVAAEFAHSAVGSVDEDAVEARGRVGDVTEEILSEADSLDPRFLVIGTRQRSPVGKALFGSTAQTLLLNAACPVVSTRSEE